MLSLIEIESCVINAKVFPDSDSSIAIKYLDCIEDTENFVEIFFKSESEKDLKYLISKLPEEERELVHMLFYQSCSLKSYADKNGINYLRAVRIRKRVFRKLGCYLNHDLS